MKNKKYLVLIILLLLTVVTGYIVSGTYAKYTTQVSGSDSATVAKWAWSINDSDISSSTNKSFTLNLFDKSTILDENCSEKETDIDTTKDIIAPGTCGKFDITITNKSDVKASYAYTLSATNTNNIPLEYSTNGTSWGTLDSLSTSLQGELAANSTASSQTIYWRWKFEGSNDTADTNLGFGGTAQVTLNANLTLTQIN